MTYGGCSEGGHAARCSVSRTESPFCHRSCLTNGPLSEGYAPLFYFDACILELIRVLAEFVLQSVERRGTRTSDSVCNSVQRGRPRRPQNRRAMTQPPQSYTARRQLANAAPWTGSNDDWNRLHSMLLEVPGGEWTVADGAKLSGVDPPVCHAIFNAMADSGFLARRSNGTFVRASMASSAQSDRTEDLAPHSVPEDPENAPLNRIRREYLEMPGLRLTETQAQRLCGMDAAVLEPAIRRLLAERFLCRTPGGACAREKRKWPRPTPVKATLAAHRGWQSA
jgi:hypothetical protein